MDAENNPGSILRREREARGLSVGEVSSHLRLSQRQVEALEAGDHAAIPGSVFVRGFIRNYARLLQIDPAPLLAMIEHASPDKSALLPKDEGIPFPSGQTKSWVHYAIWVVLLAFPVLVYEMYRENHAPLPMHAKPDAGHTTAPLSAPAPFNLPVAKDIQAVPLPVSAPVSILAPASSPVSISVPAAASVSAATGPIHLAFDGAAWVEIRDAGGKIIFSRLSPAGSEQAVSGTAPFSVVIGNAHQVRLFYNGKPVDLAPYIKIDVAHLTLK